MIRFLPYLLRSAWRNRVRSALTVLGVAVAVFLVTGLAKIFEFTNDMMTSLATLQIANGDGGGE